MPSLHELICQVQAILFASSDYVRVVRIAELTQCSHDEVLKAIDGIIHKFSSNEFAMQLQQQGDAWKFGLKKEYLPTVEKLFSQTELTKSVMETLAIIAWKAPVLQSEIIHIRTNKAYDHIAELQDKGFVTKEKTGRSYTVKLTQKFYDYFDVQSREQIQEVFADVENKPKQKSELPQKKVIDFDGKPRKSAHIHPKHMHEIDQPAPERNFVEQKQINRQEVTHMKTLHSSALDEIEKKLSISQEERNQLLQDIANRKLQVYDTEREQSALEEANQSEAQEPVEEPTQDDTPIATEDKTTDDAPIVEEQSDTRVVDNEPAVEEQPKQNATTQSEETNVAPKDETALSKEIDDEFSVLEKHLSEHDR